MQVKHYCQALSLVLESDLKFFVFVTLLLSSISLHAQPIYFPISSEFPMQQFRGHGSPPQAAAAAHK
jgi:hypothetical protein